MKKILFIVSLFVSYSVFAQENIKLNIIGNDNGQNSTVVDSLVGSNISDTVAMSPVLNEVKVPESVSPQDSSYAVIGQRVRSKKLDVTRDVAVSNSRFSLTTNMFDWLYFVTPNLSAQLAVAQHWTVLAECKYNNWSFNDESIDNRIRQARREFSLGFRWWGWYTYTGWWIGGKAMYREYSGNWALAHSFSDWTNRQLKEEGDAYGLVLSGGYSIQLTRWLDLDLGIGIWGGYTQYKQYSGEADGTGAVCPRYGKRIDAEVDAPASTAFFVGPAEVCLSLIFIL